MMQTQMNTAHHHALRKLLAEFDRVCRGLDIPYILFAGTMLGAVRHQDIIPWDDDVDVLMLREDYNRFLREAESILDQETFYLQKEFSAHWPMFFSKLRLNGTTCLEKYHPKDPQSHQGIYMDIFPCDHAAKNGFGRWLQFCASKVVIAKSLRARGYETGSWSKKLFMGACRLLPMAPFLNLVRGGKKTGWMHTFLAGASAYRKNIFPAAYMTERMQIMLAGKLYPTSAHHDAVLRQLYGDYTAEPSPQQREQKQHAILVDTAHSYEHYAHYRDSMDFKVRTRSLR